MKGGMEQKQKGMIVVDLNGVDMSVIEKLGVCMRLAGVRKASGSGRTGGAGGISSRRKGGKGRKGPAF